MPDTPDHDLWRRTDTAAQEDYAGRTLSYFADLIEVVVGTDEHVFHVHKTPITRASPFFVAAVSAKWSQSDRKDEKGGGVVSLPEDDPFIFSLFIQFAYSGTLSLPDPDSHGKADRPPITTRTLFKLYVLADRLQAEAL
ncbi:Hypothetical protein D9617_8g050680 [Elsinoe fawcettii]|nr:Hypothetical protein D9617_8g050680 [Elsinoe fawcettii]